MQVDSKGGGINKGWEETGSLGRVEWGRGIKGDEGGGSLKGWWEELVVAVVLVRFMMVVVGRASGNDYAAGP